MEMTFLCLKKDLTLFTARSDNDLSSGHKLNEKISKLYDKYWFWNREIIIPNAIIIDPIVIENQDELVYRGRKIDIEINEKDVIDTIFRAGLIEIVRKDLPQISLESGNIFFEGKEAALRSYYSGFPNDITNVFVVDAVGPLFKNDKGIAVFEKVKVENKKHL